jgi:endonuclease-3
VRVLGEVADGRTRAVWRGLNGSTMNPDSRNVDGRVIELHRRLVAEYGKPVWCRCDPVATLVSTILSQNTNDTNRDRAYARLRTLFPSWEEVRDAPLDDVVGAVQTAGLAPTKAPRIQSALERITAERGEISLDFLERWPTDAARKWLLSMPGVGPKTAAIVLCFAFGKPAFPVDTHVHRVTRRLGLIPQKTTREKAHELLEDVVPRRMYFSLHLNLIAHGRAVCHARGPECTGCAVRSLCDYYAKTRPA